MAVYNHKTDCPWALGLIWQLARNVSLMIDKTVQKKVTMHQVTTMPATAKNVRFPGHNHLLTTSTDNPTL